jgi:hypothetical protein
VEELPSWSSSWVGVEQSHVASQHLVCHRPPPHIAPPLRKRKRRRREGPHKRKRRKREQKQNLRESGLDMCAASSRRWLEKRRRAGATVVHPRHEHDVTAMDPHFWPLNPDGDFSFFDLDFP